MTPRSLPSGKIDKLDIIIAMRIHILVLDEVFDTGLSTLLDTLRIANDLTDMAGASSTRFNVSVVGVPAVVRHSPPISGTAVPAFDRRATGCSAGSSAWGKNPDPLREALKRRDI